MEAERIRNIREMEEILKKMTLLISDLHRACADWEEMLPAYKRLSDYYHSEQWMADREDAVESERTDLLDSDLFGEDVLYDLCCDQRELALYMAETALKALAQ